MDTFEEIIEKVESFNKEELQKIKNVIEERWTLIKHQELVEAIEEARNERNEGKTIILSSPEEIKNWFSKMIEDED